MPIRRQLRKLFSRSDDVSIQGELAKQDSNSGQAHTPAPAAHASELPSSLSERLWDQSYDALKTQDAALVQTYEKILSRKLCGQGFSSPVAESEHNIIAQDDPHTRRNQMRQLIHEGLKKTEKEANVKEVIGTATEFIFSAKDIISSALQAVPQAALAWAGVCIALEMIQNPIAATEANRNGIKYVTKRMDWYWKLSSVVLKENIKDGGLSDVRRELETQVIDLYKTLLSYEMKSICSYYRNRGLVLLRDIGNLDDWNGDMQAIQNAERVFRDDSNAFAGLKMISNLEQLVTHAEIQSTARITKEDQQCMKDLCLTDPSDDKKRIEQTKGGLLQESYSWILDNPDYQQWRDTEESRLLWIKGDPGKGKTMLLCGIVSELDRQSTSLDPVSYFFFQATDQRLNNATTALRGLIFMLANQQPSLISHIRKKYDNSGGKLFDGPNAWIALSDILVAILQDPILKSTCLVVDALDECIHDLQKLLDLIVLTSSTTCAKWIVSSRNWSQIEERLRRAEQKVKLSLELNAESISGAVDIYIEKRMRQLSDLKGYDEETCKSVRDYLSNNANDTFLWVALVCQNLEKYPRWKVLKMLDTFPPGLESLYRRMMEQVLSLDDDGDVSLRKQILAAMTIVYRPVALRELCCLIDMPEELSDDIESLKEVVALCGSFLTIRDGTIYFVHQSAKDHLTKNEGAFSTIFPTGRGDVHHTIFSLSLQAMNRTLRKNIYALPYLGSLIEDGISIPDPDPLSALRYSCVHWVDHFCEANADGISAARRTDFEDDGVVSLFLQEHFLHWLESLSLLQNISTGIISVTKLESLFSAQSPNAQLLSFLQDARRFIRHNLRPIEIAPLQAYSSALVFSPMQSLVRRAFDHEMPAWICNKPAVEDNWSPRLQVLEGHTATVLSVAVSADGCQIASGSWDKTVKIWDIATGTCIWTLNGHSDPVNSVAFSTNNQQVASGSEDKTIKIWDLATGMCDQTLEGHAHMISSVAFSLNGQVASASGDGTIKIWNLATSTCIQTFVGHNFHPTSVTFLADGQIVSSSVDKTIKIWNIAMGTCVQTLTGHKYQVHSVAVSADGCKVASGSSDNTIKIWDIATGTCIQTLEGHSNHINSVAFLANGQVASGAADKTVKIWDIDKGKCVQTLEGHDSYVTSVATLANGQLVSGGIDNTIMIWDTTTRATRAQRFEGHDRLIREMAFSSDGQQVISASEDKTIKIWDVATEACIKTLSGHTKRVLSIAVSGDGLIASGSPDRTVRIWDMGTGVCVQLLEGNKKHVKSVAFSADGQQVASMSSKSTVKIWNVATGVCVRTLEDHDDSVASGFEIVESGSFSADMRQAASRSSNNTVAVWDIATGTCLHRFSGYKSKITSQALSSDNLYLALGLDKAVKIWDIASGECIQSLNIGTAHYLSFDTRINSRLYSNLGTLDLNLTPVSGPAPAMPSSQSGNLHGYGIDEDGVGVMKDGKPMLWLPLEYRPTASAVVGSTVAIGCNGRVLMMRFAEAGPDA